MKLDVKALALACAIVWGSGVLLGTWWIIVLDGPQDGVPVLGQLYRGYTVTPVGSVIGLAWAVVDGLIAGAILAWVYNRFCANE